MVDGAALTIGFDPGTFDLEVLLAALPASVRPSFIYERRSTRDRAPTRTFVGFDATAASATGADAFDGLRRVLADAGAEQDKIFAFLSFEALTGDPLAADTPRELLLRPRQLLDIDHATGAISVIGSAVFDSSAIERAAATAFPSDEPPSARPEVEALDAWSLDRDEVEFVESAEALKAALAGDADVVGAVMSVEVSKRSDVDPLAAYRALRRINPATCMFFVEQGAFALWGSTSLPILSVDGGRIVAETDGATRRVEPGDDEEWRPDAKENAEYDLVVSALRHDLDGVVEPGSLRFVADREPRRYFNLQHLFAEIEGELAPGVDAVEALRRLTPHGAATGYAKPGAVALIERHDARPRGPYAGAIGMFGANGFADVACVIRSAWKQGSLVRTRAGAKVVAASDPAAEYREGLVKTLPLRRSVAMA